MPTISTSMRHLILVLTILGVMFLLGVPYFRNYAASRAEDWLKPEIARLDSVSKLEFPSGQLELDRAKMRLTEQYDYARKRAKLHLDVMIFFYARYYMAIAMTTLLTFLSAICLAFISRTGWASANSYLISCFIVFSAAAAFFGAYPALYRQAENVEENKRLYISYIALENRLRTYIALWQPNSVQVKEPGEFILDVDKDLMGLNNLPVGIDPGAIKGLREELTSLGREQQPAGEGAGR